MKRNKINAFLFALLLAPAIASCGGSSGNEPAPGTYVTDAPKETLSTTVHRISVTPNPGRAFVYDENGVPTTKYQIVYDKSNSASLTAASFIAGRLADATGAEFPLVGTDVLLTKSSRYIVVGREDLFATAGLSLPSDVDLRPAGYYIKNYGNSLFFEAAGTNGYQMGSLRLLNTLVGYDMISEDTVIYEGDYSTLPDIEIAERPDFDERNYTNFMTMGTKYGLGYSTGYPFMTVGGLGVHNIFAYLPTSKYLDKAKNPDTYHPEWYSDNAAYRQLCYTARGDDASLNQMLDAAFEVLKTTVDSFPDRSYVTFTHADNSYACTCDACQAQIHKDGAMSGTIIRFINKLDDRLQNYLQAQAEANGTQKRKVHLCFFAYLSSEEPPVVTPDEDPTLKCNDDVAVFIAPLHAKYVKNFEDPVNEVYANSFRKWHRFASNALAWVYEADYHHYLFPYNTYSSMMDIYRFCKQNGASFIYNEGQRNSANVTCFGKLKEYLDSKAQIDVNASYDHYVNKFFTHYFGPASEIMRDYYEQMRDWETHLESDSSNGLGGGIYQEIGSDSSFWPKRLLENWLDQMDRAREAIASLKTVDPVRYAAISKHILIESIFPRYALVTLHPARYSESELLAMRLSFKEDADALGIVEQAEHHVITEVYESWGIN